MIPLIEFNCTPDGLAENWVYKQSRRLGRCYEQRVVRSKIMIAQVAFFCAILIAVSGTAYVPAPIAYAKAPLHYTAIAKAPLAYTTIVKRPVVYKPAVLKAAPIVYSAPVVRHRPVVYSRPVYAHAPLAYSGLLGHSYYGHGHAVYTPKVGYRKVLW